MGLLLHNDNDVSGLLARELVSLAVECILLVVGCSLIDFSLEDLLLLNHLFAIAGLALVFLVNDLTLTAAIITGSSGLTVHAGAKHLHFVDHTTSAAGSTLLNGAFLASETIALAANTFAVHGNLGGLTSVDFLEGHFEGVHDGLALLGALLLLATLASKHLGEDIVHAGSAATTAFLKAFLTILVVDVTLFLIREHFVGIL